MHQYTYYSIVGTAYSTEVVHLSIQGSLWQDHTVGLTTNIVPIDILCDDYPMLANQEPIQLQGRPTCMSLALNAFMVMPTK